jgi:hypothetical protein
MPIDVDHSKILSLNTLQQLLQTFPVIGVLHQPKNHREKLESNKNNI